MIKTVISHRPTQTDTDIFPHEPQITGYAFNPDGIKDKDGFHWAGGAGTRGKKRVIALRTKMKWVTFHAP